MELTGPVRGSWIHSQPTHLPRIEMTSDAFLTPAYLVPGEIGLTMHSRERTIPIILACNAWGQAWRDPAIAATSPSSLPAMHGVKHGGTLPLQQPAHHPCLQCMGSSMEGPCHCSNQPIILACNAWGQAWRDPAIAATRYVVWCL